MNFGGLYQDVQLVLLSYTGRATVIRKKLLTNLDNLEISLQHCIIWRCEFLFKSFVSVQTKMLILLAQELQVEKNPRILAEFVVTKTM